MAHVPVDFPRYRKLPGASQLGLRVGLGADTAEVAVLARQLAGMAADPRLVDLDHATQRLLAIVSHGGSFS